MGMLEAIVDFRPMHQHVHAIKGPICSWLWPCSVPPQDPRQSTDYASSPNSRGTHFLALDWVATRLITSHYAIHRLALWVSSTAAWTRMSR